MSEAFISSVSKGLGGLRADLYEFGQSSGYPLYVDERVRFRNLAIDDPLTIADELLESIRTSKRFVCILGGSGRGSAVRVEGQDSNVSFFEIELFQAALLRKPIHVFVIEGFSPEPRLERLLQLLHFAFPHWNGLQPLTQSQVFERIGQLVREPAMPRFRFPLSSRSLIRRMVHSFFIGRSHIGAGVPKGDVRFLDDGRTPSGRQPNLDLAVAALESARSEANEQNRLSRIWVAVRELMTDLEGGKPDTEGLIHLNDALGQWSSAASWYGLHAHIQMGALAALNSAADVRRTLRDRGAKGIDPQAVAFPGGSLASAKYSIAKLLPNRRAKEAMLRDALSDATCCSALGVDPLGDALSVRAAIVDAIGARSASVADYEEVLRRRKAAGADGPSVGIALSDLGFAYALSGQRARGRGMIEDGVRLLDGHVRAGFLARARRKLAAAYLITGRPIAAYRELQLSRQAARASGALDQER